MRAFIQLALPLQHKHAAGVYQCIEAYLQTTSEWSAWVKCSFGGTLWAVQVIKNGPGMQAYRPSDPNSQRTPVFADDGGEMTRS